MLTLQEFITEYTGKSNVGDTPENKGQCVGLIEVWTDNLGIVHTWGNADQLLADADPSVFNVFNFPPVSVPNPGDILTFDSTYGNGAGHTGIVVSATSTSVVLFEQNDPLGHAPQEKTYTYAHSLGYMHPKVIEEMMMVNKNMAIDLGVGILGRSIAAANDPTYIDSVINQPADVVIRNLVNSPEAVAFRARAAEVPTAVINNVTYVPK